MFAEAMDKMIAIIRSSEKSDWFTFASGKSACGNLTTYRSGEQFHGLAIKCGVCGYRATSGTLVAMYEQCDDVVKYSVAEMKVKDVISFNSLICTLAIKEAVEMFKDIIKDGGLVPE